MAVHSTQVGALEGTMQTLTSPETLPIESGDVEWVADLFDTMHAGDLDAVAEKLDEVAYRIRKAAKARRMLAAVDPRLLADGLALQRSRTEAVR
jgi:hypothetical protein